MLSLNFHEGAGLHEQEDNFPGVFLRNRNGCLSHAIICSAMPSSVQRAIGLLILWKFMTAVVSSVHLIPGYFKQLHLLVETVVTKF